MAKLNRSIEFRCAGLLLTQVAQTTWGQVP
jgi:hypothetical protein